MRKFLKALKIIALSVSIASCMVLPLAIYALSVATAERDELKAQVTTFADHFDRIENIKQTLMIAYPISSYEAQYYAYIFDFLVRDCAVKHSVCVEWEIFATVAWCESRYYTDLVSSKKAKGVFQILEPTFKGQANKLGFRYIENRSIWNEFLNVTAGCHYIAEHYDSTMGIKAYFGGPNHAGKIGVEEYYDNVMREYNKLKAIAKGVSLSIKK